VYQGLESFNNTINIISEQGSSIDAETMFDLFDMTREIIDGFDDVVDRSAIYAQASGWGDMKELQQYPNCHEIIIVLKQLQHYKQSDDSDACERLCETFEKCWEALLDLGIDEGTNAGSLSAKVGKWRSAQVTENSTLTNAFKEELQCIARRACLYTNHPENRIPPQQLSDYEGIACKAQSALVTLSERETMRFAQSLIMYTNDMMQNMTTWCLCNAVLAEPDGSRKNPLLAQLNGGAEILAHGSPLNNMLDNVDQQRDTLRRQSRKLHACCRKVVGGDVLTHSVLAPLHGTRKPLEENPSDICCALEELLSYMYKYIGIHGDNELAHEVLVVQTRYMTNYNDQTSGIVGLPKKHGVQTRKYREFVRTKRHNKDQKLKDDAKEQHRKECREYAVSVSRDGIVDTRKKILS